MLEAARLAPNQLHEAGDRVVEFLQSQFNDDGGGKDRSGASDLYYTVFALEGLLALQADPPVAAVLSYLSTFGDGGELDLVHLTCLARCWAAMPEGSLALAVARCIARRIEAYRSGDGGYGPKQNLDTGTTYHSLLALGAYQDLHQRLPKAVDLGRCLDRLRTGDGAFANERGLQHGTTPATAAAVTLICQLDIPVPAELSDWLFARTHDRGGFLATPNAPIPDLLSTATALHALKGMQCSLEKIKVRCLDFLDSLWTGRAFHGHWADTVEDSEYTYYALLALGHLSS